MVLEASPRLRVGAHSFTFAFGSCARLDSNAATYDAIAESDPLFHLMTGDFFYGDIARDDLSPLRTGLRSSADTRSARCPVPPGSRGLHVG